MAIIGRMAHMSEVITEAEDKKVRIIPQES
jgi:hypothetical protein